MSTYQELKGLKVKYLSADTSGDRAKEGELFYYSTSGNLKAFVATQSWISTPSMGTGRSSIAVASNFAGPGSGGTQNNEEFTGETTALNLKTITDS